MKYHEIEEQVRDELEQMKYYGDSISVQDLTVYKRNVEYVVNLLRTFRLNDLANDLAMVKIAIGEVIIDMKSED